MAYHLLLEKLAFIVLSVLLSQTEYFRASRVQPVFIICGTVLKFCKHAVNIELQNSELLFLGKHRVSFLQASSYIFISHSVHSLILYMFLFKDTLFN